MLKFKYFMAITTPKDGDAALSIISGQGARGIMVMAGKGSAKHEVLDMLGFENDKKQVVTGFISEENEAALLNALYDGVLKKKGAGIAFTVGVQGFVGLRSVFVD